jgi:hypothetical protein
MSLIFGNCRGFFLSGSCSARGNFRLVVRVWQQSHQASIDNLDSRDTPEHNQQSAAHVQRSVLMAKARNVTPRYSLQLAKSKLTPS